MTGPPEPVDVTTPALVLSMVPDDFGHGRLAAARTLGRWGVPVRGVHYSGRTPAARSRYDRDPIIWPAEREPGPATLERLIGVGRTMGRPVLLPVDDVGALFVDRHLDDLRSEFLLPDQPPGLPARLANKVTLQELCHQLGVASPASVFVASSDELDAYLERAVFPVMVKSVDPRLLRLQADTTSVAMATSSDELVELYRRHQDSGPPNLMVQEFVPGDDASWILAGYFGSDASRLMVGTGRKLRDFPPGRGSTSYAVAEHNEELGRVATAFFEALGYRGPVDTCWRFDRRDGTHKLLDVNPRIGANFRLCASGGMDVVRALYLDLTGQAAAPVSAPDGRRLLVEPFDFRSVRASRPGMAGYGRWLQEVARATEKGWWARDDVRPFLAMLAVTASGGMASRLPRRRRSGS